MDKKKKKTASSGHSKTPCPACKTGLLERIHRKNWMFWLPSSKHYQCGKCGTKFLRVFDLAWIRIKRRPMPQVQGSFNTTKVKVFAVLLMLIATIYFSYSIAIHFYENEATSAQVGQ